MDDPALRALAARVFERESAAVASLAGQLDESFASVVRVLLECRGKVLVSGSGTSHATAMRFAHLLSCVGTPALFIHPGDSQHGGSGAVAAEDVVIALSRGGETTEVVFLARIARRRGARVVVITEEPGSSLGRVADLVLRARVPEGVDPYGVIATGSSLFFAALCDAVCVALLEERGYSKDAFGETHPGGAVGLRFREARG